MRVSMVRVVLIFTLIPKYRCKMINSTGCGKMFICTHCAHTCAYALVLNETPGPEQKTLIPQWCKQKGATSESTLDLFLLKDVQYFLSAVAVLAHVELCSFLLFSHHFGKKQWQRSGCWDNEKKKKVNWYINMNTKKVHFWIRHGMSTEITKTQWVEVWIALLKPAALPLKARAQYVFNSCFSSLWTNWFHDWREKTLEKICLKLRYSNWNSLLNQ